MSERSAAPVPPNYRTATKAGETCGTCRMYDDGVCWGYGNTPVETDHVCDSWSPDSARGGHMDTEHRAQLSSAEINDLPDSAFAYIEPGGSKDDGGKTTPRKLRHYPVHDKPHADDALARANAQVAGDDADAKSIAEKALPKIKAAAKKFADAEEQKAATWDAQHRGGMSYGDLQDLLCSAVSDKFCKGKDDYAWVCDFTDDAVVFSFNGEKQQAPYTLDGNDVTLGKASPVRAVTTYVPLETKSAGLTVTGSNPASPKRAFSSLVEQPPAHVAEVEMRMDAAADDSIAHFVGYASTTGVAYSVRDWLGEYDETILPGAFAKTLREQTDIPLLFNHDGIPLASTGSGTSRLSEDKVGLRNEADLDRRDGQTNSICVQLSRKVLGKMSFSFKAIKDAWNDTYDDRGVSEAALYDSSIVTYPANPTTSGELVDAIRSALGREGRSLWLADGELSVRSALPVFVQARDGGAAPADADDLLERAVRALAYADEVVCRSIGRQHGRARTFLVAQAMLELRAGKALSAKNEGLLQTALSALASADKHHAKLSASHSTAHDAVSNVLNAASGDGKDGNQGATTGGNPIAPQDGAGPRSAALKLQRQREAELRALRNRRP